MPTSDDLIRAVGVNIQEKASLIWSVADTLRGPYKPHEYGLVILPMTVIKRFHDCLAPTHDAVLAANEKYKNLAVKDGFLRDASGYPFYNTSKFTFETLKADPANIEDNFRDYINGFSKLKDDGVMAIIQDASPLYKGKPGSGEDSIRRYVLENDLLDAIVQLPCDSFYNTGIATYVWLFCKGKAPEHRDRVLLIDASKCFEKRRKGIGYKKNDITKACRDLIVRAYSEYRDGTWTATGENGQEASVEARLMETVELGFNRVCVQSPVLGEGGEPVLNKRGQMQADKSKEDTEDIPLTQDIDAYIEREVRPYNPHAWVDKKKTKVGYTIPFTRVFYKYAELEPSDTIAKRILEHEKTLEQSLETLFGEVR